MFKEFNLIQCYTLFKSLLIVSNQTQVLVSIIATRDIQIISEDVMKI